jgi:NAD(P)-dependent dehydrogenase (short-subunit alcohol dehydrogenase family)
MYVALLMLPSAARGLSTPPPPPPLTQPGLYPPIAKADPLMWMKETSGAIVVAGAASGIGEQIARLYGKKGKVYAVSRSIEPTMFEDNPNIITSRVDVTDDDSVAALVSQIKEDGETVSALFNCAVLLNGEKGPERNIKGIDKAFFMDSFAINAYGPINTTRQLLPLLAKGGAVVNLSARVGSIADDEMGGWWSYRSSKTALNHLTKLSHIETNRRGHKITFLSVHPGTTYTPMSSPFTQRRYEAGDESLHSAEFTATAIAELVAGAGEDHSGGFFDWSGQSLPF